MALAPADFAAYSRATGAPYPEDPEQRAQMTPEVLEFRRNQLRGQEQESNLPGVLGALGAAAGVLGLGALAARRMGRGAAQTPLSKVSGANIGDIEKIGLGAKVRQAEDFTRQQRAERPSGVQLADLNQRKAVYEAVAAKPESELPTVYRPKGGITEDVSITDPNTGEIFMRGQSPKGFAERYVSDLGPTLVDRQSNTALNQTDQFINAVESGEDQSSGRIMRGIQRNEDLDIGSVNAVFSETDNVAVAASLTPDGIPKDQTNPWGAATVPAQINALESSTAQNLRLLPAATQGKQQQTQSFLEQKRQELTGKFSPTRVERILASDPEIAQAAELYAATGDPNVLNRFSNAPSSPTTIKPAVQMSINDEELPTGQFFKPTGFSENTGDLLERDIELTNKISELGAEKLEIARKAKELGEQELMLRYAMEAEPGAGGPYTQMFAKVKNQQQSLIDPEALNVDIGDAMAERDFIRNQAESLTNLGSTYKLADLEEGVRPYYEYDQYGQPIAETLEIRGGRKAIDLEPKGGGGRRLAQFDPQGQSGSQVGLYGVEQAAKAAGATTRPTQMTMNELVREGMEQASADPYGDVPIPPSLPQMTERKPTAQARRSLEVSQIMRQAMIEGRDPQMILRQRGFNV